MLKFQSATKFVKLDQLPREWPVFHRGRQCKHTVWLRSDEKFRSGVLKFLSPYGPVLIKNSTIIFFFNLADRQKSNGLMTNVFIIKILVDIE